MLVVWFVLWAAVFRLASAELLCSKCRYFLYNSNPELRKCSAFPIIDYAAIRKAEQQRLRDILITGYETPLELPAIEYTHCYIAREREDLCGVNGKRFAQRL